MMNLLVRMLREMGPGSYAPARAAVFLYILVLALCCPPAHGSCNVIAGAPAFEKNEAHWDITNIGDSPATICGFFLSWPEGNGNLLLIMLDDLEVFAEARRPPEARIDSGWRGPNSRRTVEPGQIRYLGLVFENKAALEGYEIGASFCEDCSLGLPALRCRIEGPEVLCDDEVVTYAARVDERPYNLSNTWKEDGLAVGEGKNLQFQGRLYALGEHNLQLAVAEIDQSRVISTSVCSLKVLVIKRPDATITVVE